MHFLEILLRNMTEFTEVKAQRILNPTSINLGEFVINPYSGCEFGCLYCYARSNRVALRKNKPWGSYVDIRINALVLLEKELAEKKAGTVLLGSTTECFQPIDNKYKLTGKILDILNQHEVKYVILTRSPDILKYIDLLKSGFCKEIYFTTNCFNDDAMKLFEPRSPDFHERDAAINKLLENGIPVIPYFSPVLPGVSDIQTVFTKFPNARKIEFECLNFQLANIDQIISAIGFINQDLKTNYEKMAVNTEFYNEVWLGIKNDIETLARQVNKQTKIYIHEFGNYFQNKYQG
jgi:DNA repair photolyase